MNPQEEIAMLPYLSTLFVVVIALFGAALIVRGHRSRNQRRERLIFVRNRSRF